jgi:ribonuclease HI
MVTTDSQVCVDTVDKWAAGWERNGWKRKRRAIKNLDLVQELYRLARSSARAQIALDQVAQRVLWNEYADALATAYRRGAP